MEWNEIDFEVVPSVSASPLSMNILYGDGAKKSESHNYARDVDPTDSWHVYEIQWTPDYISFLLDDK